MIQDILIAVVMLVCVGGMVVAAWSIKYSQQLAAAAREEALSALSPAPFAHGGFIEHRAYTIGEIAKHFMVPAHLLASLSAPIHFDTWMRQRTDLAHAEFMGRTSRLPC